MSKVYVLTATSTSVKTLGVFSSYAAMMTYLYANYYYEASYKDHIVPSTKTENYGCFIPKLLIDGKFYALRYEAFDLIGETSHKTGKLVIKPH